MNDAETPNHSAAPGLALGAAAAARPAANSYRVLARKYRPATFDDLIGQDAMVRTISNAFETGRIPQAWILTGVRGVGKTTTARILARALNYELPDGSITGPTIKMPVLGQHCQAIMESRHLDVLEMDAASHNSVDDVRQINDAVRYAPVSARYKVYILDEVHMLSPQAFNALLKTLEEPPPHAKFIFATTEIRKVPVTILSRCQRFDLRRIDAALLVKHLQNIAAKEEVAVEPEALALIARAADGSVRDSLSLLDQAIAHAAGTVRAEDVRQMLGLADRARIVDLFEALMRGDIAAALKELREQYEIGADPATVLTDLADFTHFVTRVKIVPAIAEDISLSEVERTRGHAFATQLSMRVLSRTWQMLLKGLGDMKDAARPLFAAEMVLVRIAYAADLPTPDEVMRALGEEQRSGGARLQGNGGTVSAPSASGATAPRYETSRGGPRAAMSPATAPMGDPVARLGEAEPSAPALAIGRFEDLIALAAEKRDLTIKTALERDVRLVRFEDGQLEINLQPSAAKTLVGDLSRKLTAWTGRRWMIAVSSEPGAPTIRSQMDEQKAELMRGVRADPLVQSVLARFPGAEIVEVRRAGGDAGAPETLPADDHSPANDERED
ncbi:MAG: polymerase subunit gamma/tau [Alphaproteobacteria bacterium]|jgi:DNA polymerase-3 subunit gamma/tau|nr:polymerase subunit gamma/tau [Alphaproteobacteria bacterium]